MHFLKIVAVIITTFSVFKLINADVLVCDNNECKRVGVLSTDSLFSELNTIIESNRNTTKVLEEQNKRIENKIEGLKMEIENIKTGLHLQTKKLLTQIAEQNSTPESENKYSLYDKLWILIQKRQDGSVNFYRNWTEYKDGFGNQVGEFFVGLETIHNLTNDRDHELIVMLEDFNGTMKYAHYDHFLIGNETERYRLKKLGKYSGKAGDHLRLHVNMFFSTMDRDNDEADEGNCAEWFKGAWWFYHCLTSNLNGPYRNSSILKGKERGIGVVWGSYDQIQYSFKSAQMMLRSK